MLSNLVQTIIWVLTGSPAAPALWMACLWFLLLLNRKKLCKFVCLLAGLDDPYLIADLIKREDLPCQALFTMLAVFPFFSLVSSKFLGQLVHIGYWLAAFTAAHMIISAGDIMLSAWHLSKRHSNLPEVFRFCLLSVLYLASALILLDWMLGVNVVPLLATSSIIAAVMGLALQDTLKNVFAGLTLSLEASVKQGHWVNFKTDGSDSSTGQIMEIGWRSTKIRTLNNNIAIIPNTMFIQNELINYNSPTAVKGSALDFPLPIRLDPCSVVEALVEAAAAVEGVLQKPAPCASAHEVKIDQIVYQLRFWVNGMQGQEQITSNVIKACWSKITGMAGYPK